MEDYGYFGDDTFLEPFDIAFMGNPADLLIPELDEEELDEARFWAEFERGWEQAEIEMDERGWDD